MIVVNNRERVEWHEGMSVQGLLDALGYDYALITVTVNGDLVAEDDYGVRRVPDGAEVSVFHLAHGG